MAKKRATRVPRTATGKQAVPELLASAEQASRAGMKERTEAGHLLAGRTPPSRESAPPRHSGATQLVEDAIREPPPVTEDEKLLQEHGPRADFTRSDPWRVLRIMSEFIEGFDTLAGITKGVSIFGSARTGPDDPQYAAAREDARLLAAAGES